jgi:ribose transport system ATP-binding protein
MTDTRAPRLDMSGISKAFGATVALDDVDLVAGAGEVHALIGENGAGKSTLMKVLAGALPPDAGDMRLDGSRYAPNGPTAAREHGVAMIYQELNLAEHLTVEANVMLGVEAHRFGVLKRQVMRERVAEALTALNHPEIAPDVPVRTLSVGVKQLVEIARAIVLEARVIVLDEPTSSLSHEDTEHLFGLIRRLRDRGACIIYISHFLEEIREIADRYTVLRDGRTTGTGAVRDTSTEAIIEMMVGRRLGDMFPRSPHTPGDVILRLKDLCGDPIPTDVNLELRRGEVLGIAGLIGAGRTELLRSVFGLDPVTRGTIRVAAITDRGATPAKRLGQGVGLLSEDRKSEGLATGLSVVDNMTLSHLTPFARFGWLNLRARRVAGERWLERLSIRARNVEQPVASLSGGNQQKVAIARLLHHDCDVLLLDEPTRGIDVGSKVQVYELIGKLAEQGKAVLFVSSYLPELLGVCDRIGVMSRGKLVEILPTAEWTEQRIMAVATGGEV